MKRLVLTLAILLAFTLGGVAQCVSFDFEDGTLQGWTTLDADGDGHCWQFSSTEGLGHGGSNGMVVSYSTDPVTGTPLTPDNYLVSPRITLPAEGGNITYHTYDLYQSYTYMEYEIAISTTVNNDPTAFTTIHEHALYPDPGGWGYSSICLTEYGGREVYIAFRHLNNTGQSVTLCIDDIQIDGEIVVAQDNTHYVDAIQICGTDGQTQFPLTFNGGYAESGPYYGCLYTQPNPAWFFVKMDEPGEVFIHLNVQNNGGFNDLDFCCWGPFSALPDSSEELTQDKVVDCSYNSSVPITCTIPSEAQTGEYYVLVVTNYANMPGDLIFTIVGGAGSLECPGTHQREWYYEIQNENGSITYQYMYQAGDTVVQDEPTHILVKINTLYNKDIHTEVTHEYVYERDGKLYWWNKTLEEFTVLYDLGAQEGDTWVIKVGTETLTMHVDAVDYIEYEGITYRVIHVSDPDDLFSGDIVCGIGHLTSFFPERLMDNGDGVRVEGLRCYWVEDELVFKYGDEDCDAIYEELHGVKEDGPSSGSGTLLVYPNPTNNILFVQTLRATSLPNQTYRITNLMGQTLLTGQITAETQQIDVSDLPQGMYFITIGDTTRKFVVR